MMVGDLTIYISIDREINPDFNILGLFFLDLFFWLLVMIRHGKAPFLECSSKGDKRFSAFYARIKRRDNKSIEEIYQAAKIFDNGYTNLHWKQAKGKKPVNIEECKKLYSELWDEYIAENPDLLVPLCSASGVSDIFGQPERACQATELWRIRCSILKDQ